MYVTDKTGRKYRLPTAEETQRIRTGIAADPDAYELTDTEMAELRPLARLPGRPKTEQTQERLAPAGRHA